MKTLIAFVWVAAPKLAAGGGQVLINLFLLRHLGPEPYGALSLCLSTILLLDSFLGSVVDMAILKLCPSLVAKGASSRSLEIQKAALFFKPLAVLLFTAPVLMFQERLGMAFFQRQDLSYLFTLTSLALASVLVLRSIQTHFQVEEKFKWYGGIDLVHNSLRYGFIALAAALGFVTPGVVLATYAIVPALLTVSLLLTSARSLMKLSFSRDAAKELYAVLALFIPAAAAGGITSRMDVFFVAHMTGVGQAGIFTAAQQVGLPILLLGTYLCVVFGPKLMPMYQDGSLKAFYRKFQTGIIGAAMVIYAFLWVANIWLSPLVFPAKFHQSSTVLLVLFPSLLAGLVSFPLTISLLLFLRPRFIFMLDMCAIPLLCLAYYWAAPRYGAIGVAGVTTAYALLKLVVLQAAGWRLLSGQTPEQSPRFFDSLALSEEY